VLNKVGNWPDFQSMPQAEIVLKLKISISDIFLNLFDVKLLKEVTTKIEFNKTSLRLSTITG